MDNKIYKFLPEIFNNLMVNGFEISSKQYLFVFSLLDKIPADFQKERITNILCPILAKSLEDQLTIATIIDSYLSTVVEIDTKEEDDIEEKESKEEENDPDTAKEENTKSEPKNENPSIKRREQENTNQKARPKKIKNKNETPPNVWNITIQNVPQLTFTSQFNETFGQLNYRQYLKTKEINIPKTINYVAKRGILTHFHFKQKSKRASYLMLLQRDSFQNHESHFYDALFQSLKENDIDIERFFFYADPRICWNNQFPEGISLRNIANQHSNTTLILVGNLGRIINKKGRLRPWTEIFNVWETKILILSNLKDRWAGAEKLLSRFFKLIPPEEKEIKSLANYILSNKSIELLDRKIEYDIKHRTIFYKDNLLNTLQYYFELPLINWIAACAIYPALYWDLTLHLGETVAKNEDLITIENILQLLRLPWFRTGKIPPRARQHLMDYLEEEHFRKVTEAIINQMKQSPPDVSSTSYDDYSFQLVLFELFLNPSDKNLLARFHELKQRPNIEVDQILLQHLYNKNNKSREFAIESPIKQTNIVTDGGDIHLGQKVSGIIDGIAEYGAFLDVGGVRGLIHISEISNEEIKHPSEVLSMNQYVDAKIVMIDKDKGRIAFSIRQLEEEEHFYNFIEGETVEGKVINFKPFGAFIDLGKGFTGLLHSSEIGWERGVNPEDFFEINQKIKVKILKKDLSKKYIFLSYKQLLDDPWENLEEKIATGDVINAKLTNIVYYGLFFEIVAGINGLVHVSEVSWKDTNAKSIEKIYSIGEHYDVKVLSIDKEAKKISLSIKRLINDPWDNLNSSIIDKIIKGKVIKIEENRVLFELEEGIKGVVQRNEIAWSWNPLDININHHFEKGLIFDLKVLKIEDEKRQLVLSKKQMITNPWIERLNKLKLASINEGEVIAIEKEKVWMKINSGEIGILPRTEVIWSNNQIDLNDFFQVGEFHRVFIDYINYESLKLILSKKQLTQNPYEKELDELIGQIVIGQLISKAKNKIWFDIGNDLEGYISITKKDTFHKSWTFGAKKLVKILSIAPKKKRIRLEIGENIPSISNDEIINAVINIEIIEVFEDRIEVISEKKTKGLIANSEISWSKLLANPKNKFVVGEKCKAIVIGYLSLEGKLNLSIKKLTKDPWFDFKEKVKIGDNTICKFKLKDPSKDIWVELEREIDGVIPSTELTWTPRDFIVDEFFQQNSHNKVKIIGIRERDRVVVLSLKRLIESPWKKLEENIIVGETILKGIVIRVDKTTVVFEMENSMIGFLPKSEVLWGNKDIKLNDYFQIGEHHKLKVINIEQDTGEIAVSYKQLTKDPWANAKKRFPINSIINGKIIFFENHRALVEIEPGIEGWVHESELSWNNRQKEVSIFLKIGESYKFIIIDRYDDLRNLELSIKRLEIDPWKKLTIQQIQKGDKREGKVTEITKDGVWLEILPNVEGFLPSNEVTWSFKPIKLDEKFKIGENYQILISEFDAELRILLLSIKQHKKNPFKVFEDSSNVGDILIGKIIELSKGGAWLELPSSIEGYVPISEFQISPLVKYRMGEKHSVKILEMDIGQKRLILSFKEAYAHEQFWNNLNKKLKVGKIIKGIVTEINDNGINILLESGALGIIPNSEISWFKIPDKTNKLFKKGDTYKVKIIRIEETTARFILSLKQLPNPPFN